MYQVVFFDLGGVVFEDALSNPGPFAQRLNLAPDSFHEIYVATDDPGYSTGKIADQARWSMFAEMLPELSRPVWQQLLTWYKESYHPITSVQAFIRTLNSLPISRGILSDQPPTITRYLRTTYSDTFSLFSQDLTCISSEAGVSKRDPNDTLFRLAIQRAGCQPEEILYIDDNLNHLHRASTFGMRSYHFNRARSLPALLDELSAMLCSPHIT